MNPLNIILWADLQCPYCFAGEENLRHAIDELGIRDRIRMDIKAAEIHRDEDGDGSRNMEQILQEKDEMSEEEARRRIGEIDSMLRDEAGIETDFGSCRESNDRDAHRLCKLARDFGTEQDLRDALHQAYFRDGKKLSSRERLMEAAEKAGMDLSLARDCLEKDWYHNEVLNDEAELDSLGAESVPYMRIGQEVIPEHLTKEEYMEVLRRHL